MRSLSTCEGAIEVPPTRTAGKRRNQDSPRAAGMALLGIFATIVSTARGQMDPAEIQRQMQQQLGGGSGGGGGAPAPNRIGQLFSAAGAGGAAIARSAREHPRAAAAATVGAATAVWVGSETRRSGLLVCRSPRISLFRPSDAYLSWVLESAADAPVESPVRGVILSTLKDPDAEEELEDGAHDGEQGGTGAEPSGGRFGRGGGRAKGSRRTVGSGGARRRPTSGKVEADEPGLGAAEIMAAVGKARDAEREGVYTEKVLHGQGAVKSVCAGVRVGKGLGLFHKFAQGLGNLDVFDGRGDCELLAAESSSEDLGSTLGLLTRPAVGTWSLSPVRVVLRRETSSPVPRATAEYGSRPSGGSGEGGSGRGRRGSNGGKRRRKSRRRSGKESKRKESEQGEPKEEPKVHRQYSMALSAVKGAGWSGTWLFRVTYDAETEEVWFQTSLAQRRGAFGTTVGGNQEARVKRVNEDMLERGNKHTAVLRTREEQFTRVSSLARSRARDAKALERDRILNPDKYKRVHRYMREDSYTTGGTTAKPARWGEERRRNDIRIK